MIVRLSIINPLFVKGERDRSRRYERDDILTGAGNSTSPLSKPHVFQMPLGHKQSNWDKNGNWAETGERSTSGKILKCTQKDISSLTSTP
jgi:hypothetical protein